MNQSVSRPMVALLLVIGVAAFVFYWRVGTEKVPGNYNVTKGNYRLEDGQYDEAIKEFTTAISHNSEHVSAHLGLAITYMQMGRDNEALEEFNTTITLDPNLAAAFADRGILYDRMGRYEEALADYKKSIALDPEVLEGPGFLWRFMRNIDKKPPTIADRARYLEEELQKPADKRTLQVPEIDEEQRMYKLKK